MASFLFNHINEIPQLPTEHALALAVLDATKSGDYRSACRGKVETLRPLL